jgi:outer membrane protein assembly factor BamB
MTLPRGNECGRARRQEFEFGGHSARRVAYGLVAVMLAMLGVIARAGTPVLTRSYDNGRTGANTTEKSFMPDQVAAHGLRKLYTLTLGTDNPRIEAQPLYVPGVMMSDGQVHNVLYVFSMSNNLWAFDADNGKAIWPQPINFGPPFLPQPGDAATDNGINMSLGFVSTPVVDSDAGVIYAVHWQAPSNQRVFVVEAIGLADGQRKRTPLTFGASVVNATGTKISFDQVQTQRAALLLTPLPVPGAPSPQGPKMLYAAFTGSDGAPPSTATQQHHGWILAFDVTAWKQAGFWTPTPSSFGGGIWQASQGPAADEQGNVYFMTGNGGFLVAGGTKTDFIGTTDFAECFIKLAPGATPTGPTLNLVDWYAPFRDSGRTVVGGYDYTDQDLAAGGPVLPPGTNLLLGAGKDGVLYVFDRTNLGKSVNDPRKLKAPPIFFTFDPDPTISSYKNASPTGNLDFIPALGMKTHHLHGTPVFWRSKALKSMLFVWGENGSLRAFSFDESTGVAKLLAQGTDVASATLADPRRQGFGGMPGGMLSLSADGGANGIVWSTAPIDGDANKEAVAGVARAYDATQFDPNPDPTQPSILRRIWQQSGFTYCKFVPPIVADGKLFVPTYDGQILVYTQNSAPLTRARAPR